MLARGLRERGQPSPCLPVLLGRDVRDPGAERREVAVELRLDDERGKKLAVGLEGTAGSRGSTGYAAAVVLGATVGVFDEVAGVAHVLLAVADVQASARSLRRGEAAFEEAALTSALAPLRSPRKLPAEKALDGAANDLRVFGGGIEENVADVAQDVDVDAKLVTELGATRSRRQG